MTGLAGFWVGLGLLFLGLGIDNGICEFAKVWKDRTNREMEWREKWVLKQH
jgi:hypothetical protein